MIRFVDLNKRIDKIRMNYSEWISNFTSTQNRQLTTKPIWLYTTINMMTAVAWLFAIVVVVAQIPHFFLLLSSECQQDCNFIEEIQLQAIKFIVLPKVEYQCRWKVFRNTNCSVAQTGGRCFCDRNLVSVRFCFISHIKCSNRQQQKQITHVYVILKFITKCTISLANREFFLSFFSLSLSLFFF